MKKILIAVLLSMLMFVLVSCAPVPVTETKENASLKSLTEIAMIVNYTDRTMMNSAATAHYLVYELKDGTRGLTKVKGSNSDYAIGDIVEIQFNKQIHHNGKIIRIIDKAPIDWRGF